MAAMSSHTPPIEAVAAIAQRLAVLLAAGVPPNAAWRYLDEVATDAAGAAPLASSQRSLLPHVGGVRRSGGGAGRFSLGGRRERIDESQAAALTARVLRAAARAGARGENIAEAIRYAVPAIAQPNLRMSPAHSPALDGAAVALGSNVHRSAQAWLALAASWSVAQESGAPLAGTLRELAAAFRDQAQLERDLAVALSGPRATARLVGMMPAIGVLFGALMGFDTVNTLLFTAPGLVCLATGVSLMATGARWSSALVRRAAGTLDSAGLLVQLTAIAMTGGTSSERALALAARAHERYAASGAPKSGTETGPKVSADVVMIDGVLALSRRAGVPAAELLRSDAQQARLAARSDGQERAAKLGVSLMIPLGLCVLPAFMLLGVVPLLISVLASTLSVL